MRYRSFVRHHNELLSTGNTKKFCSCRCESGRQNRSSHFLNSRTAQHFNERKKCAISQNLRAPQNSVELDIEINIGNNIDDRRFGFSTFSIHLRSLKTLSLSLVLSFCERSHPVTLSAIVRGQSRRLCQSRHRLSFSFFLVLLLCRLHRVSVDRVVCLKIETL